MAYYSINLAGKTLLFVNDELEFRSGQARLVQRGG